VFDIIDTTASDDIEYIAWLTEEVQAGRINPSQVRVNQEIGAIMFSKSPVNEIINKVFTPELVGAR
jgi:hypothetical protein